MKKTIGILFLCFAAANSGFVKQSDPLDVSEFIEIPSTDPYQLPLPYSGPTLPTPMEIPDITDGVQQLTAAEVSKNENMVATLKGMRLKELIEFTWDNLKYRDVVGEKILPENFQLEEKRITIDKGHIPFWNQGIDEMSLAVKFLKLFGKWLKRLEFIIDGFSDDENLQLLALIEQNCKNLFEAALPMKWNPYLRMESVKRVVLGKNCKQIQRDLKLNEVYPNMEQIQIDTSSGRIEISDASIFAQSYPKVRNFTYSIYKEGVHLQVIENLLQNNPQIDCVALDGKHSHELFQKINTRLPNMKTFSFDAYPELFDESKRPLHFNEVTTLTIRNWKDNNLSGFGLVFEKVESVTYWQSVYIDAFRSSEFNWLMAMNNQNLKELSMPSTLIGFNGLTELSANYPRLESIKFRMPGGSLTNNNFMQLLNKPNMKLIEIRDVQTSQKDELAEVLPPDWNIMLDIGREWTASGKLVLTRN